MMKVTNITGLTAMVLCALCANLNAERTCRMVYPERPNDAPKTAYVFDGKSSRQVDLPSMNFSEVLELPDGKLTIAMTTQAVADPKVLPKGAPTLQIPEGVDDFYIIITPNPDNKALPLKMNLVDAGGAKLKLGQTLWFNLTGHRIIAKLGEVGMKVEPRSKIITKAPLPQSGYYVAKIAYQADGAAPITPITKQSWLYDAKSRHLGFIANTGGKLPKLYYYRDYRLPKHLQVEAEAAGADDGAADGT